MFFKFQSSPFFCYNFSEHLCRIYFPRLYRSDLHLGTSMGFKLPSRSLTYRLSPSSRLSQLLQAKKKRRWGRLMSVTTTLSKNQLAFIPVLSCSILGSQCDMTFYPGGDQKKSFSHDSHTHTHACSLSLHCSSPSDKKGQSALI